MRNIIKVIKEIKKDLVNEVVSEDFVTELNSIIESASFAAPEVIGVQWDRLINAVNYYCTPPELDFEWNVISKLTDISVENLKK